MILVIGEQRGGTLNRVTWESLAGAQALTAAGAQGPVSVLLIGTGLQAAATELAAAAVHEVITVEHPALEPYTPDGYTAALAHAIGELKPSLVVLPHTYQTRDFAPKLAARLDRAILTDVTAVKAHGNAP